MKKAIVSLSLVVFSCVSFASNPCEGIDVRDNLPLKQGMYFKVEAERPFYNMCEMVLNIGHELVPAFATKDWVLSGDMYIGGKNVAKEYAEKIRKEIFHRHMEELAKLPYIPYTPNGYNNKSKFVYFLADPNSVYTNKVKKEVMSLADKYKYQIRLLLFPLLDNPPSVEKAATFLCQHKTYQDFMNMNFQNYKSNPCNQGFEEEQKIYQTLKYVQAVPLFIFDSGKVVVGANTKLLKEYMQEGK